MVDVDVYIINDVEYYLIGEEVIRDTFYLYLSNVNDDEDVMIRKRDKEDKEVLLPLDNEQEVKMAALVFANKVLK